MEDMIGKPLLRYLVDKYLNSDMITQNILETSSGYEHVDFILKCLNESDMNILRLTYSLDYDYITEFNKLVKQMGNDKKLKHTLNCVCVNKY